MAATVRIAVWTMRHGGQERTAIARTVAGWGADLTVVPEYRRGDGGGDLEAELLRHGLASAVDSAPRPGRNGVLVSAGRGGLTVSQKDGCPLPDLRSRVIRVSWRGLSLLAFSAPSPKGGPDRQERFAEALWHMVRLRPDAWLAGDLKSDGPDDGTPTGALIARLIRAGYRRLGPTGARSPHLLVPPDAARVRSACLLRPAGDLSDRPALLVDLASLAVPAGHEDHVAAPAGNDRDGLPARGLGRGTGGSHVVLPQHGGQRGTGHGHGQPVAETAPRPAAEGQPGGGVLGQREAIDRVEALRPEGTWSQIHGGVMMNQPRRQAEFGARGEFMAGHRVRGAERSAEHGYDRALPQRFQDNEVEVTLQPGAVPGTDPAVDLAQNARCVGHSLHGPGQGGRGSLVSRDHHCGERVAEAPRDGACQPLDAVTGPGVRHRLPQGTVEPRRVVGEVRPRCRRRSRPGPPTGAPTAGEVMQQQLPQGGGNRCPSGAEQCVQQQIEHQPLAVAEQCHGPACGPVPYGPFRQLAQLRPEVGSPPAERSAQFPPASAVFRTPGDQDGRPADEGTEDVVGVGAAPLVSGAAKGVHDVGRTACDHERGPSGAVDPEGGADQASAHVQQSGGPMRPQM